MKKLLITDCFAVLIMSCDKKRSENSVASNNNATSDSLAQDLKKPTDIQGTYKGEISCDDCESAELTLKENNTYSLLLYLSSEVKTANSIVNANGKYNWNKDSTVIFLDQYDLHFKVGNGKLYYLDHQSNTDENEVLVKEK